ncbi:RpiB/LacA/LacB family sugar-phosphate isomerase [Mucilaginibacter arboris]|uniref:RpiB/LacA/LacB family sugar-phosphate isomerase n=1 Tax=Mucilaginibacter arboris TaxID=2682090 RepID=A0A7K1SZ39_9SPHI|nr:RpiB/LacA/LacB family sugar-phosphate isomerase [Mucilaginibacter arboris]MVN22310.1 RpiB/LacA/LacB family sugar-phosphate isomerase [Mucilaginibacter arboris]
MKVGISADHGGFELKEMLRDYLKGLGHEVTDFGAQSLVQLDDFPDYVIPMARAVANKEVERGIAVCGSGVGACIAANKVHGVRAALITDHFSAHQGVEDDNMNVMAIGGRVVGFNVAQELVNSFLKAAFIGAERHLRRLDKVDQIDK